MKQPAKITILVMLTFLASFSSESLASYMDHALSSYSGYFAGVNYAIDPYYNARAALYFTAYRDSHRINYDYHIMSIASVTERDKSRPRFSSNILFTLPALFLSIKTNSKLLADFVYPLHISNARVQYHFSPNIFYATAGQNTDLFMFNSPSKICTESVIGLEYITRRGRTRLIAEYHLPWVRGYRQDRKPYLSFGIAPLLFDLWIFD